MFRKAHQLAGFSLIAADGDIGILEEFYFDEEFWTIRYLAVKPGTWLPHRHVLISPVSLGGIDDERKVIQVTLTMEQIKNSPPIDTRDTVTEQYERQYYDYYALPLYWSASGRWGAGLYPSSLLASEAEKPAEEEVETKTGNPFLRSTRGIEGYILSTRDGARIRAEDFLFDDETWAIRYLLINTGDVQREQKTLLPPYWIDAINWQKKEISVDVESVTIKTAPPYDPARPVTREYEQHLFRHYGREQDIGWVRIRQKSTGYR